MPIGINIFPRGSGGGGGGSSSYILVTVATTGNIDLTSAPSSIDSYSSLVSGTSTILVKNQTPDTGSGNPADGIYLFNGAGNPLTRLTSYTAWNPFINLLVGVQNGNDNGNSLWASTARSGGTLGTTNLQFIDMSEVSISPDNYAEVAINGVDGTNLNLTINGALTALGSANGIINLFPNYGNTPYSMPTMSLNNKKITSVDACSVSSEINFCNIQADVGTLPVASGDLFSISNCLIAGTVANPVPVVINNIIGVVATFNDVQFVSSYPNAGISITAGATIGTSHYYFNNCTGTIALNGSPNNFIYIYFNNCNMTINNNAPQGAAFWIQDNNSALTINSNGGHWNCFNTTFGINSTISGGIHDVFSAINCNSTSIVTFGDGNPFTTSGLVNVLLYNCQMNHNANSYNANTIIVGSNNTVVNLQSSVTPTYNLLMSQCQITANCNTVAMVINLPPLNTPSTFIHLLPYLIFQFNKQDASTRTLTIVASSGDYVQYGAQQVNSIVLNTPQSFNLGITSPNNTTSAWIAI